MSATAEKEASGNLENPGPHAQQGREAGWEPSLHVAPLERHVLPHGPVSYLASQDVLPGVP